MHWLWGKIEKKRKKEVFKLPIKLGNQAHIGKVLTNTIPSSHET